MSEILKRLGFASPEQVRQAVIAANVAAANPRMPRIESDGTDLDNNYRYREVLPFSGLGSTYWTPKHSPKY